MPKELFNQTLKTTYSATDRIATGVPGQTGCDNGLIDDFFKYALRAEGEVAVTTGDNAITFSSDFGTTNYSVMLYDYQGIGIELKAGTKASTGFTVTSLSNGYFNYVAIKNI